MKAVVFRIRGSHLQTHDYKSATIEITNATGLQCGYFMISSREDIVISTDNVSLRSGTSLFSAYNSTSSNRQVQVSANTDTYIYIEGEFTAKLTISDITAVDTFDASIPTDIDDIQSYRGLEMYAKDLMKFSMVSHLGLRYSVKDPELFDENSFIYFENLTILQIGAPGDQRTFETIHLADDVMRQLVVLNIGIKKVPSNFNKLANCEYIYLYTNPSWEDYIEVTGTFRFRKCKYFANPHVSLPDTAKAENFLWYFCSSNCGFNCNLRP